MSDRRGGFETRPYAVSNNPGSVLRYVMLEQQRRR